MNKSVFRFIGQMLFVLTFLISAISKFNNVFVAKKIYEQNYDYCRVSVRTYNIFLPHPDQFEEYSILLVYSIAIFQFIIAAVLLLGKKLAGYLLLIYYLSEEFVIYLIFKVGRGRSLKNIYFQYEIARFIALIGISTALTYQGYQQKKPF